MLHNKKFSTLNQLQKWNLYSQWMKRFSTAMSKKSDANTSLFSGSCTGSFFQDKPEVGNQFTGDHLLKSVLKKLLPADVFNDVEVDLQYFGKSVSGEILVHHNNVCCNEPVLEQYDAWGKRVDNIIMHPSWKSLHDIAAKEKLISIPYENKYEEWSRIYQIAKLYLFSPVSGLYSCPLAMTDGAASILKSESREPFITAFNNLTSNDSNVFWTSGQWMTEKKGGSDVGNATETLAVPQTDGTYKLYGYKWFTSATDANMSLTLARIVDKSGKITKGSKGLTMFYLETRKLDESLNGIRIEKLKKKVGTRQMPTAELILDGATAYQLSEIGRGITSISPMLTITRIHNSVTAVSNMRRLLNLSKDFARKRSAFGTQLCNHPLHVQTLARMEVEQQGGFVMLMKVSSLLGRVENKKASDHERLVFRILTPLLKLYTAKQAISTASEGLESFGGYGYLEDTGLPVFLRDAQVLSIWEGTTNILSLDVLRSIAKTEGEVLKALFTDAFTLISKTHNSNNLLQESHKVLTNAIHAMQQFSNEFHGKDETFLSSAARDFAYSLSRIYIGCLLYENAVNSCDNDASAHVAYRWAVCQDLIPVVTNDRKSLYSARSHIFDNLITYGDL